MIKDEELDKMSVEQLKLRIKDYDKSYNDFLNALIRELSAAGNWKPKTHLIDELVLATQNFVEELKTYRARDKGGVYKVWMIEYNCQTFLFKTKEDAILTQAEIGFNRCILNEVIPMDFKTWGLRDLTDLQKKLLGITK